MNLASKIRTGQFFIDQESNRIQFNDTRFYLHEPTGEFYPSVTTVLGLAYPKDPYFYQWLKDNGQEADAIRDAAGEAGSIVHQMTEDYDAGLDVSYINENGNPKYSSQEWELFEKYADFCETYQPIMTHIEINLVSPTFKVGGTLDRIMRLNIVNKKTSEERKLLMDIKTSKTIQDSYWIQTSIYKRMWEELYPDDKIDDTCILWLKSATRGPSKTGEIQGAGWRLLMQPESHDYYAGLWDHTKALFDHQFGAMKPKHLTYSLSHKKTIK